jgi:mediator of replication checkpoint protein 1
MRTWTRRRSPKRKSSRNICEPPRSLSQRSFTLNKYPVCYSEHQDADDARLEKEVQDVVAGKKRTGRHRGAGGLLGSDGSDESDDDEEARALRRRLAKKRRVEGDTLDELARNPATASFHATYQMALVDDAEEFAHLDRDEDVELEAQLDRDDQGGQDEGGEEGDGQDREEGGEDRRGEGEDEEEDVEMAEPSQTGKEEISAAEVRKELQQVARGERVRRFRTLCFSTYLLLLSPTNTACPSLSTGIPCT